MTEYFDLNRPVPFSGTDEEREQNRKTHDWNYTDDEERCWTCDSKSWHEAANYPCGVEPEREWVKIPRTPITEEN